MIVRAGRACVRPGRWIGALALLLLPATAGAQDRDLCPDRPGLGSPPCTVAPGHVLVETGLADWTRDDTPDAREDLVVIGSTLLRVGVADAAELQVEWTPLGHDRVRDRLSGDVTRANRVGDLSLGAKVNLSNPDSSGFSIAVAPSVTLPIGRTPIGAGDWGATVLVPVSYDLSSTLSLQLTPEIDAAVDEDGRGRHLSYGSVVGLGIALADAVQATVEFQALRDADPAGHTTQSFGAVSLAWQPTDALQLDVGGAAGLNRDTPDARVYAGIARLF